MLGINEQLISNSMENVLKQIQKEILREDWYTISLQVN